MNKNSPWLILGGTGQLGRELQDYLVEQKIIHLAPKKNELDLISEIDVLGYIKDTKPFLIINCAAWTDVDLAEAKESDALQINGYAVEYLARSAKKFNSKFVHISTDYIFSGNGEKPWSENDQSDPKTAYGRTKKYAEYAIHSVYPENSLIFRTAWLYSKYGENFVKSILAKATYTKEDLFIVNDQIGQPTLASDLAKQIVLSINHKLQPGVYHGTNSGQASWYDFALEVFTLTGQDQSRIKPISSSMLKRPATRPAYSVLGHEAWLKSGVPEMRNWKLALQSFLTEISKDPK